MSLSPTAILAIALMTVCFFAAYYTLFKLMAGIRPPFLAKFILKTLFILIAAIPLFLLLSLFADGTTYIVLALILYFSVRLWEEYNHIQSTLAILDTERKQHLIAALVPYADPLSRFLSRHHPTWYPPPISDRLQAEIAAYARFLRDLARANGQTPSTAPDEELIKSPFNERSFSTSWNFG